MKIRKILFYELIPKMKKNRTKIHSIVKCLAWLLLLKQPRYFDFAFCLRLREPQQENDVVGSGCKSLKCLTLKGKITFKSLH